MSVLGWNLRLSALVLALAWQTSSTSAAAAHPAAPPSPSQEQSARNNADSQPQMTRDQMITAQATDRLHQAGLFRQAEIGVETKDGLVTLEGTVPSNFARSQSVELARSIPGVVGVENHLRLITGSPEAPEPRN
jgi:osmotically-inducible protein OsmY